MIWFIITRGKGEHLGLSGRLRWPNKTLSSELLTISTYLIFHLMGEKVGSELKPLQKNDTTELIVIMDGSREYVILGEITALNRAFGLELCFLVAC